MLCEEGKKEERGEKEGREGSVWKRGKRKGGRREKEGGKKFLPTDRPRREGGRKHGLLRLHHLGGRRPPPAGTGAGAVGAVGVVVASLLQALLGKEGREKESGTAEANEIDLTRVESDERRRRGVSVPRCPLLPPPPLPHSVPPFPPFPLFVLPFC